MVFFQLQDPTPDSKEKLVAACKKYLSEHDGTVYFSVGTRAADMARDVNEVEFDVALHLVFRNKAAHDTYQTSPRHQKFIDECKAGWKKVRVFDSYLGARKEGIRIMFVMVLGLFFVTAPRASGDVKSATVNLPRHPSPVTIQYEVHNGVAIFQGDIELGKESELNTPVRRGYAWSSKDRVGMISQPLAVKAGDDVLWPGGIVPYVIDSNVPSGLSSEIQGAVQDYNRTNIKLQQRNEENDYVRFVKDDNIKGAGQSSIGRQGGRQDIKLKSDAGTATVIHELGHAIGLWHEQARNDRDRQRRYWLHGTNWKYWSYWNQRKYW